MQVFSGETADDAWLKAVEYFRTSSSSIASVETRGGRTAEVLHTAFSIRDPRQRWVASRFPPLNPAFAIADVFWILGGRNDAAFLTPWNSQLPRFVGAAEHLHGAYGKRLRHGFGFDQLTAAYEALRNQPTSRQVVLQIWDPHLDFPSDAGQPRSEDIPCNLCSLLKVRNGRLEWLQVLRSNDLILGAPYNFVQFTMLQEIMAGWLDLDLGEYVQISDSLHVYERDRASVDASRGSTCPFNIDSLALRKSEFAEVLAIMVQAIDELGSAGSARNRIEELRLPVAYQNLLLVVAAEAARRQRDAERIKRAMEACTNQALAYLWSRWQLRF